MVGRPLFVAHREAPPLLDPVAFPVDGPVERSRAPFVPLARDRDPDPAPPQGGTDPSATIALVAHDALGPQLRLPARRPFDRPLRHQLLEGGRLMALARRQHEGDGLPIALTANMHLRAEPTLAPAEGLGWWVPLFAPAACWWARMTVAST